MATKLPLVLFLAILSLSSAFDFMEELTYPDGYKDIPTDANFTVSTFIGDWNVVGVYGVNGITPHSCPTVNVKQTVTASLVITLTAINVNTSTYYVASKTYQPSPLNKAILIDILTITNRQNVAVSFYDDTLGQALLINMNSLFAVALSKANNIYTNMFLETVNDIFVEAGLALNQTVFTSQYGCATNYTTASDFNAKAFPGKYYGNAVFTTSSALANLSCFNVEIQKGVADNSNAYNLTQYLQYNDSVANFSTTYIPAPESAAFLINIDDNAVPSLVVNYYNPADDLYILLAHDGAFALIVSTKTSLDDSTITLKNILINEGLSVSSSTFFVSPNTCPTVDFDILSF